MAPPEINSAWSGGSLLDRLTPDQLFLQKFFLRVNYYPSVAIISVTDSIIFGQKASVIDVRLIDFGTPATTLGLQVGPKSHP